LLRYLLRLAVSMTNTLNITPGSIVTCRSRQWVVLPSENEEIIRLRPLSGNEDEIAGIYRQLGVEKIEPATFPLPEAKLVKDHKAALLLMSAARLLLRSGAGPFRCFGRLSVRARPYQLVPLLMALRLETIRLLIADDVGIGKTIEAGLIAREFLDRGEASRIAVLCPPHLCDQWQRELKQKFHIDAVVVRSGTVAKLERGLPSAHAHIFSYYRHLVISLDYAKAERRRASFITHCPDFVIVDEAHTCARPSGKSSQQQQRHQLVQEIAEKPDRHLLLLTATPHSGVEESFLSILGLLQPEFANFSLDNLTDKQRDKLSSHFVQRRRADVKQWLGDETPFPERESAEHAYKLSREYRDLFESVYNFARGLVKTTTEDMSFAQRRGRYWSALALIRCVMSSPAAAVATLGKKGNVDTSESGLLDEDLMSSYLYDPTDQEQVFDTSPVCNSALASSTSEDALKRNYERKLKEFVQAADKLRGDKDQKLKSCIAIVESLLNYR
jgi:SNF2-related domain